MSLRLEEVLKGTVVIKIHIHVKANYDNVKNLISTLIPGNIMVTYKSSSTECLRGRHSTTNCIREKFGHKILNSKNLFRKRNCESFAGAS